VKILHNFSWSYKCELLGSILHPQTINLKTLHISNYRSLPAAKTLNKFISTYVKSSSAAVNVIIQTRRIDNYLKTVLYILKLVNTKYEVGLDISNYDSGIYSVSEEFDPYNNSGPPTSSSCGGDGGGSSMGGGSSVRGGCGGSSGECCSSSSLGYGSQRSEDEGLDLHHPHHHQNQGEGEGIMGALPSASNNNNSSNSEANSMRGDSESESVSFHLGDNCEDEPTFSRLTLGDVDVNRLLQMKAVPIEMERVMCSIENLDKYVNIQVEFDEATLKFPNDKLFFINYSNSVNKLYEMQWMHSSILDVHAQLTTTNTKAKYIIYNIDKNSIKYVNVVERDCNVFEIVDYLVREKCSNEKITEYLLLHLDTI
jgi:hypothetical protein